MNGQHGITGHEHCLRPGCGRRLICAASRARGYGWGCWRKVRAAVKAGEPAGYSARQADQARELIEDGALVPAPVTGLFLAVSTDGQEVYDTSADTCSCPASGACYHRLAACLVLAA